MRQSIGNSEGTKLRVVVLRRGRLYEEAAIEAGFLSEVLGTYLVTHRARDTIFRGGIPGIVAKGEVGEHLPELALFLLLEARGRHMTIGASVLDLRLLSWMIHVLAANAGLPIRIAGGVTHDAGAPIETDRDILP